MSRDPHKGRVEFQDSDGQTYYLKMGTNAFVEIQDELAKQHGYGHTLVFFHQALVKGDVSQKDMTREEAGDLIDELGYVRVKELTDQTTFSKNIAALAAASGVEIG